MLSSLSVFGGPAVAEQVVAQAAGAEKRGPLDWPSAWTPVDDAQGGERGAESAGPESAATSGKPSPSAAAPSEQPAIGPGTEAGPAIGPDARPPSGTQPLPQAPLTRTAAAMSPPATNRACLRMPNLPVAARPYDKFRRGGIVEPLVRVDHTFQARTGSIVRVGTASSSATV